jgi:hypothetical protein
LQQDFLGFCRRNEWENQDADVKSAVKKDTPAGKYTIKRADSKGVEAGGKKMPCAQHKNETL